MVTFNLIIFDSLLELNSYNYTFFEKNYTINTWLWQKIKLFYILIIVFNWSIVFKKTYEKYLQSYKYAAEQSLDKIKKADQLHLDVGTNTSDNSKVSIPEKGLFQNILITGTIGTGKTSSAMYPFVEQLISQNVGMLVLDVKGNFHIQLKEIAKKYNKKVTVIELGRKRKIQLVRQTQFETICFSKPIAYNINVIFKPTHH